MTLSATSASGGIACTPKELIYLASLREGKAIFGLDDPLLGYSQVQIEDAFIEAREGLRQRSYLLLEDDGTLVLDEDVVRLVDTVAKPRRTVLAVMALGSATDATEQGIRRVFHVRGSSVAEIVQEQTTVQVRPLAERGAIADAVLDFWETNDQPAARGQQFQVPQQAMQVAAKLAAERGVQACEAHLVDLGVDADTASSLSNTFAAPVRNTAVLTFDINGPRGRTVAMGMLEGPNGMWRLRPVPKVGQPLVEVTPCAGPTLAALIHDFVNATTAR